MLSVVLPVRNWSGERISACARSFLRLKSSTLGELLIVDFGSDEPVAAPVPDPRLRLIRAEADVWSAGEAINIGVLHAQGSVIAKVDADMVLAANAGPALDRAAKSALSGDLGLGIAQPLDLPPHIGPEDALENPPTELDAIGRVRPRWGEGGLVIFSRDTWDAVGGLESRFTGWGNEDNDFAERVRRSGRRVRWLDRNALKMYHVWHLPSVFNRGVVARRAANMKLASTDRSVFRPIRLLHSAPPPEYRGRGFSHPAVHLRASPLVTVAFASAERKNRTRMLTESIRSYLGQADNDLEIVVADNGSTAAEHARLCSALRDLRLTVPVRPIRIETPSIPAARNVITEDAAGRYICVADDDDIALPNRIADHLACFQKDSSIHGSHGGWIDFDELTGVIEVNEGKERTLETLLFGTGKITAHPTCFYRKDVLRRIPYDESLDLGSDLDLALRMASAGLKVAHTHSFVMLRRFHASNVTLTGLSSQVSNGSNARQRVQQSLGPAVCAELAERAKASDRLAYCRNRMDGQRILEILPSYAGVWRLQFPLSALGGTAGRADALAQSAGPLLPTDVATELTDPTPNPAVGSPVDADRVARVLAIVDGEIEAVGTGINLGFAFVSRALRGARQALRTRKKLAAIGIDAEIIADRDTLDRRERPFSWSKLSVPQGARRLLSAPVSDPVEVMEALARMPAGSVLQGMLSVISDGGPDGFRYFLVTGPLKGRAAVARAAAALHRFSPVRFTPVANGGVPCDI